MKGKLIVIDGTDGSGKATQTKKIIEKLQSMGKNTETLDFPQYESNYFGHIIRSYLDGAFGDPTKINPYLSSILYAADRFESSTKIKQWLYEEKIVVLDRYVSANQIHQGAKIQDDKQRETFLNWLDKIEHSIFAIPRPDLILYLDVNPDISQKAMQNRANQDKHESNLDFQKNSHTQSLRLVQQMNNWQKIQCDKNGQFLPVEQIYKKIWDVIKNVL